MKRVRSKSIALVFFACLAAVVVLLVTKRHAPPPPQTKPGANKPAAAAAAAVSAPIAHSKSPDSDSSGAGIGEPRQPVEFVASSIWQLTPRESAPAPASPAAHAPAGSHQHADGVIVADLDTRAAATSLPNVKPGDDLELALPNGEIARARVNLVTRDAGVLRLGGALPDKQRGSFALALNDRAQLFGMILLRDIELAYTIEAAAQPGVSHIEAAALSDVICHPYEDPPAPPADGGKPRPAAQPVDAFAAPDSPQAFASVPIHSSRPSAPAVLYLDFDGATVTDTYWNDGVTINAAAANLTEAQITEIWKGVAEAYSPFNIDVTTNPARYSGAPVGKRMRCIITPTYQWYSTSNGTRGVALRHSFAKAGGLFASDTPCWIFVPTWYSYIPLVTAHELGHTLGLIHDGLGALSPNGRSEYFGGHGGTGPMSWGPIMGNPSYRNVNQWSKGEYAWASNTEDDFAIITSTANGVAYYDDGIGNTRAAATAITIPATGSVSKSGVIINSADEAWYIFTITAAKTYSFAAAPSEVAAKLDIHMQLLDSGGNVLVNDNPSEALTALIERPLAAGTYYIKIQGASYSDGVYEGYTRYGSAGQYTLTCAAISTIGAPVISTHPQSKNVTTEDASFTLSVTASGGGNLRYQWQKDGVDLISDEHHPDVTGATLTITYPTAAAAGQYRVKVRNAGGETTSNAATVTIVAPPPPVIVTPPQDFTAIENYTYYANFSVNATGAGSLTYQWQKDGININNIYGKYYGATSSYLEISQPVSADNGQYRVIVSNRGGSTTSAAATLTVTLPPPPAITSQPAGVTKTEGDSGWSYNPITLTVSASSVATLSFQWKKDGQNVVSDDRISGATSRTLSISRYIEADSGDYTVVVSNTGGSVTSGVATVVIQPPAPPQIISQPVNVTAYAGGSTVYLSVYASGQALRYQWQLDGVDIPGATSSSYSIYNPQSSHEGAYTVKVWNSSGALTSTPARLTVSLPPVPLFTLQPSPLNLCEGSIIHLESYVSSQSSHTCQWYKNGQAIAGATSSYYYKQNIVLSDAGVYKLIVTNPGGSSSTNEVAVVVTPAVPPKFIVQPENQRAYAGDSVKFVAVAEGNPAPAFIWYKNGVKTASSSPMLTVENVQPGNTDKYHVVAANVAGSAASIEVVATAEPAASGNGIALLPAKKHVGAGRVVYQLQVRTNMRWNLWTDATWLAFSKNDGYFTDTLEVTVAPNPLPIRRTAIVNMAGLTHTIIQEAAGTSIRELWAVGSNTYGQLGDNAMLQAGIPVYIAGDIKAVASSGNHTLILKKDGTLWTVGNNGYGQLGTGSYSSSTGQPVKIADSVKSVAAAGNWSAFIKDDDTLWGMGYNGSGQLGSDRAYYIYTPVQIATAVKAVAAGDSHLLYIKTDNTLWGMGGNTYGQLGNNSTAAQGTPVQIASDVRSVCASTESSAYIKNDNTLWQFGCNMHGMFGDGSTASYYNANSTPRQTAAQVQAVSLGSYHSMILKSDGTLLSSGYNYYGQLGIGSTSDKNTYAQVATAVTAIFATGNASVFLKSDGSLWGAGQNSSGMFPGISSDNLTAPVCLSKEVLSLSAGPGCLFMFMKDATLYACGNDSSGQLGSGINSGSARLRRTPVQIDSDVISITAGPSHSMYIKIDKSLWAAGSNGYSTLGISGLKNTSVPMQIAADVKDAGAGSDYSMYIKSDGTVYGIGHNYDRQIGSSSHYGAHTVYDIYQWTSVATDAISLALGGAHTLLRKSDGSLWAMGSAGSGALGDARGFYDNFYTPREMVPAVTAMAAGGSHTLYIKNDGTLWGRGNNNSRQLGSSTESVIVPAIQIASSVRAVAAGGAHSLWIADDGALWGAGSNYYGQLGLGDTNSASVPVAIANDVRKVSTSDMHTFYITNGNRLFGMGANTTGQLGDGTLARAKTPIEVAANIDSVSAGGSHTLFIATGDIRLDPPPPPVIESFSPTTITAQSKVVITGSNFTGAAGVYFGSVPSDSYTVDSPTQITAYAPVIPTEETGRVYVGTFDGVASSAGAFSAAYVPVIGEQPSDQIVHLGSSITIEPSVLGAPNSSIAWQYSTDNGATWRALPADLIHSVNAATGALTIANAPLSINGYRYKFTANNVHGSVTSQPFAVAIAGPPVLVAQSGDPTVTLGQNATLTATFNGMPVPAYHWQMSTNGGATWLNLSNASPYSGVNTATLTITAATFALNTAHYRCVATNDHGSAESTPVRLTVQFAPNPAIPGVASQTVVTGRNVTLYANAAANPAPSYQWQVSTNGGTSWSDISDDALYRGTTSAMLDILGATVAMNGYKYRAVATNSLGVTPGNPVTLTVLGAQFSRPTGLVAYQGNLYITDASRHTVQKVVPSTGVASVIAGSTGVSGTTFTGAGAVVRFDQPMDIAVDSNGVLCVADKGNSALRYLKTDGSYAGYMRFTDTTINTAPGAVAVTSSGQTTYFAAPDAHIVCAYGKSGTSLPVSALAGFPGHPDFVNGTGSVTRLNNPSAITINGNYLYVSDAGNHAIRSIYYATGAVTTLAGNGAAGMTDGTGTAARFNTPRGMVVVSNTIFVADSGNATIRTVSAAGAVETIAGNPGVHGLRDGIGQDAWFDQPHDITYDGSGNLYIADTGNALIRKLNLATREVTTLAITSTAAAISPPVITSHPQSTTATQGVGGPLTLTFSATGAGTLTSKWQKNGADITASSHYVLGANSLSIYNHTTADSGQYRVIVSNEGGTATSNAATVTVTASTTGTTGGNGGNGGGGGGGGGGASSLWHLVALFGLVAHGAYRGRKR